MSVDYRIYITDDALADLKAISDYIGQRSPLNAARFIERLLDEIDGLEDKPHRFKIVGETSATRQPVHSLVVRPYIVYYRIDEVIRRVFVLTVRHGRQRSPGRFP